MSLSVLTKVFFFLAVVVFLPRRSQKGILLATLGSSHWHKKICILVWLAFAYTTTLPFVTNGGIPCSAFLHIHIWLTWVGGRGGTLWCVKYTCLHQEHELRFVLFLPALILWKRLGSEQAPPCFGILVAGFGWGEGMHEVQMDVIESKGTHEANVLLAVLGEIAPSLCGELRGRMKCVSSLFGGTLRQ